MANLSVEEPDALMCARPGLWEPWRVTARATRPKAPSELLPKSPGPIGLERSQQKQGSDEACWKRASTSDIRLTYRDLIPEKAAIIGHIYLVGISIPANPPISARRGF